MDRGSLIAPIALIAWIPITIALFASLRPAAAAAVSMLGAYLLLPSAYGFDFRGLPPLDKGNIASIACAAACVAVSPRLLTSFPRASRVVPLLALLLGGCVITGLLNSQPVVTQKLLRGMSMWDTLSLTSDVLLGMALPFILGHVLFREVRDLQFFLGALMVGLLVYSLPMLWEVRMSPQLHSQVYGYFPFVAFEQMRRAEGFRPLVFTVHGLSLATVTAYAVVATAALVRIGWKRLPSLPLPATLYLAVVLAFCKSLGPIVFAIIGVPLGILASPRVQVRLAVLVVCVVLLYPAARASGVLPADTFAGVVEIVSTDRAQSLRYRLRNEDLAIAHAVAKPFFGWGTHARSHVFDPQTGRDLLTTDGYWMIVLGKQGSVGLIATFGLLAFPVFWTGTALARLKRPADRAALATFAVLSAFVVVDLLPNANVVPLTLVIVGALSGVSARLVERRPIARTARPAPAPAPTGSRPSRRVRPWPLEPVRPEGRPE